MLYGAIASSKITPAPQASVAFAGAGNLTVSAKSLLRAFANLGGTGSLSISGSTTNPLLQASAAYSGAGQLVANVGSILQGSASFAGAGQMISTLSLNVDSATNAWLEAVIDAGGTVTDARLTLVDNLILGLKSDGIWTKLDRLWLFAAENSQSALIDLVAAAAATAVSAPTFTTDRGFTGGSGYINTGFNAATAGSPKFTQDSAHWGHWNLTANPGGNDNQILSGSSNVDNSWQLSGSAHYTRTNDTGGPDTTPGSGGAGFLMSSRYSSTNRKEYFNGSNIATISANSVAVSNHPFFVLWDGTQVGNKSPSQAAAYSIGGSLDSGSDAANLHSRLSTYLTAVGAI